MVTNLEVCLRCLVRSRGPLLYSKALLRTAASPLPMLPPDSRSYRRVDSHLGVRFHPFCESLWSQMSLCSSDTQTCVHCSLSTLSAPTTCPLSFATSWNVGTQEYALFLCGIAVFAEDKNLADGTVQPDESIEFHSDEFLLSAAQT